MRTYQRNSPQAAARIVALAMLADGHMCQAELDVVDRLDVQRHLGLTRDELQAVIHTLCEDMLLASSAGWIDASRLDPRTLRELLAEVDDPRLRRRVLELCVAVIHVDKHTAEGESIMLEAAIEYWGMRLETSLSQ